MVKNIKCNVKKSVAIIFMGIALLAICFYFGFCDFRQYVDNLIFNNDIAYYLIKAFMIFGLVFLGFGILYIFKAVLFYRDKMIEFEDDHLVDRSSYVCGGKIPYADIENVYIKGMFLCIKRRDEEEFLKRQHIIKKWFMVANKKMGYEYVTISDNFLDTKLIEIEKMIRDRLTI